MLFAYKNCGCCKKEMTNTKVLLNNIFPAGICDEICDYNLHCFKCKNLKLTENEFQKEPKGKHLTTSEKTITFLQNRDANTNLFNPTPTEQTFVK